MTRVALWVGRVGTVACALLFACSGDPAADLTDDVALTGVIEGFTAPIDISIAEVVVFQDGREVRRVEFRDGEFSIPDLPPGTYRLEVRAFGYQINDAARDVQLQAGQSLDLGRFILIGDGDLMADIPKVVGFVRDSVSKAPVVGADVKVTCSAGVCTVQRATTDETGGFTVLAPAEQNLQVSFGAEGYEARLLALGPISLGETRRLDGELIQALP